ncbi:MAG: hypothetical protein QW728_06725 [Thermoplasmata archaeon]
MPSTRLRTPGGTGMPNSLAMFFASYSLSAPSLSEMDFSARSLGVSGFNPPVSSLFRRPPPF